MDAITIYNLLPGLPSHPRTFYLRLSQVTLNWYFQFFEVTSKQLAILQKWLKECPHDGKDSEESSSGGSDASNNYCSYD